MAQLKSQQQARLDASGAALDHRALLERIDFDLDHELRSAELELLDKVGKKRDAPAYRSCLPRGLTALVALRGIEAANAIAQFVAALEQQAPGIAKAHGAQLSKLAKSAAAEEQALDESEQAEAQAHASELVARAQLIRQLRKNRNALGVLYPSDPHRVRSYFRDHSHSSATPAAPPTPTVASAST